MSLATMFLLIAIAPALVLLGIAMRGAPTDNDVQAREAVSATGGNPPELLRLRGDLILGQRLSQLVRMHQDRLVYGTQAWLGWQEDPGSDTQISYSGRGVDQLLVRFYNVSAGRLNTFKAG